MTIPIDLKYTKNHEWIKVDGNKATVGITDHAQEMLGDVVFVELPNPGDITEADETAATIESVKAVSDVYSPVRGKVLEVNSELEDSPDLINKDVYGRGWIYILEIADVKDLDSLLTPDEYTKLLQKED